MEIYLEIYQDIADKIADGKFKPGDRLPSIRQAAESFGCNKITVKKAYDRLKDHGFLENTVGKGSFVRFPSFTTPRNQGMIDFSTSGISESFMPPEASELLAKLYRDMGDSVFNQGDMQGEPALIESLASLYHLDSSRMMIISGAQQGLHIAEMLFDCRAKDSILFEDPTYSGAVSLFKPRNFISLGPDGPNPEDRIVSGDPIKAFFTIQGIHNPTGMTYSLQKKQQIAQWAEKNDLYIIEDDYLSEFLPSPSLRFVDIIPDRTIYIKSLSKVTAPCFRLGILSVPHSLLKKTLHLKFISDMGSSSLTQKLLGEFIRSGLWESHLMHIMTITRERRTKINALLREYPNLSEPFPNPGYHLWIKNEGQPLPKTSPWLSGNLFSFSAENYNFFRLSFMNIREEDFELGLTQLKGLLR